MNMEDICETGPTESLTICEGGEGGGGYISRSLSAAPDWSMCYGRYL